MNPVIDPLAEHSLNAFERYGLPGLVILGLFALVVYVLMQIKRIIDDHNIRVNTIIDAHCEERSVWMQAIKDNTAALQKIAEQTISCSRLK